MSRGTILGLVMLTSAIAGCGGGEDRPTAGGTCDDAAASATCFGAVLDEISACAGGAEPLVEGALSADRTSCTDGTDPSRTATFDPPLEDTGDWGGFTIVSGGTTCANVTNIEGYEWGHEVTTPSGTFAMWYDRGIVGFSCPDGTTADVELGVYGDCDEKVSLAEATGTGSALSYNWHGMNWYRCAVP